MIRVSGVVWFSNLDYKDRYKDLTLTKEYTPELYPKYDNYDAININKTKDIPKDYTGVMGVPISFIDKYNPEQFEILGLDKDFTKDSSRGKLNGKTLYARILIKFKNPVIKF